MPKVLKSITAAALLLALTGCIPLSLSPIYTDENQVEEPLLVGVWGDPDNPGDEIWEFRDFGYGKYQLIIRKDLGDGESVANLPEPDPALDGMFEVHLAKLGDHIYMDMSPEPDEISPEINSMHRIEAHSIWRVTVNDTLFTLAPLNQDWLEEQLEEILGSPVDIDEGNVQLGKKRASGGLDMDIDEGSLLVTNEEDGAVLPMQLHEGNVLITASTDQLCKFILAHQDSIIYPDASRASRLK